MHSLLSVRAPGEGGVRAVRHAVRLRTAVAAGQKSIRSGDAQTKNDLRIFIRIRLRSTRWNPGDAGRFRHVLAHDARCVAVYLRRRDRNPLV